MSIPYMCSLYTNTRRSEFQWHFTANDLDVASNTMHIEICHVSVFINVRKDVKDVVSKQTRFVNYAIDLRDFEP